ncbi:unnamed protein product, partial [Owenia fusiformis]
RNMAAPRTNPQDPILGPPEESLEGSYDAKTAVTGMRNRYSSIEQGRRGQDIFEEDYVMLQKPENEIEAQRMANNYLFGFKKWKSHVTSRPLEDRSEIVKSLYKEESPALGRVSLFKPGNFVYVVLFGWWVALIYLLLALIMGLTIIGRQYTFFCLKLAKYFIWPFGKFIHKKASDVILQDDMSPNGRVRRDATMEERRYESFTHSPEESTTLLSDNKGIERTRSSNDPMAHRISAYWKRPSTYVWLILGFPIAVIVHCLVCFLSWLTVIFIPISKINAKTIRRILLLPPDVMEIDSADMNVRQPQGEIIMFTTNAANLYFYKYTVDGMNVILVSYLDPDNTYTSDITKFVLALLAIIPLAYYIGMAIASISAQSNFAVGAVLNATFGSVVEITLYITSLLKGIEKKTSCYSELVKSALTGTLLATMLLIPGICMVLGGIKYRVQRFNPRSQGVSSSLLFVSVAGAFAPSIFSKAYGTLECAKCVNSSTMATINSTENITWGLQCTDCYNSVFGISGDKTIYNTHIRPLVYTCAMLLPLAYIVGLVFSLKTHRSHIYDTFKSDAVEGPGHGVHWGRIKSAIILLVSTVLMSLAADLVTEHIHPLLQTSGVSIYFFGVTLLALVPDIPEIVNGIQFALQNNISLSIEVANCIAVQVCLLQIPILVLANVIKDLGLILVFTDIHLWSVIFAVIMMNYVFQDGKSNYFQGTALVLVYLALIAMYFFAPNPRGAEC